MTIQEFKTHIEEELRHKLKCDNEPTPILDRLELHLRDFDDYDLTDLLNPKNMKHDLYASFLFQICFPSRIKMDIDAEYTPIKKKRIAIVSCKRRKQNYVCNADEMYSPSPGYRAQREFFIKGYDDYYIVSSEYGIVHHTQIIKPYDRAIKVGWVNPAEGIYVGGYKEGLLEQIDQQIQWMKSKNWEIDFHTSKTYYDPLLSETKEKITHIKQPPGPNAVIPRYEKATHMLDVKPLEKCLEFIGRKSEKPKEEKAWWYHPNHEKFFGTSGTLASKYKEEGVQAGNTYNVVRGKVPQHKGWVLDESLLNKLYQTDSGQWRLKK